MRLAAGLACVGCWLLASCGARAPGSFSWAPVDSAAVARGHEVATRFDQESLFEISVEVNNAFSLDNRRAIAVAEEELRRVPGVRRVFGPAQLADLAVDGAGRISVRRVLERGASEGDDEAARQRVVRRADALGWFLAPDGSRVRFLVDAGVAASAGEDGDALVTGAGAGGGVRAPLERAIASSGLQLLHAAGVHAGGEALWPLPGDLAGRWSSAALAGAAILLALWMGRLLSRSPRRFPRGRRGLVLATAVVAGGALFVFCAVAPVRGLALRGALLAGGAAALGLLGAGVGAAGDAALARRPAARPPLVISVLAAALLAVALWLAPRAQIGTQQWRRTPFLFVSVRGDLEQPAVLRELRRLTDFVRAQPGVDSAWSVADLFFGVAFPGGGEVSRVPDTAAAAGHLLAQAGRDPAVALELAPDHREALVVARFDDDATPIDRLQIHDSVARYLRADLRTALVQVDLSDPHLSPATRLVGKGVLASDARERIIRICARSGRPLNEGEIASVERFARQAAILPAADTAKLKLEIAGVLRDFLQSGRADVAAVRLTSAERSRLADALGAASVDATVEDLRRSLAEHLGGQASDEQVTAIALALQPRLALTRQRAAARINFRAMLYGADLPTDGMLSDEVRSATLEAMGPVVGIPVAAQTPGVLRLDAMAVGGAANDRALSDFLRPSLRWGLTTGAAALVVLLIWAGRGRGLLWWPVALAPAAVVTIVPALLGEPVGMLFLSLLSGAFAGGAAGTVALVARRRA